MSTRPWAMLWLIWLCGISLTACTSTAATPCPPLPLPYPQAQRNVLPAPDSVIRRTAYQTGDTPITILQYYVDHLRNLGYQEMETTSRSVTGVYRVRTRQAEVPYRYTMRLQHIQSDQTVYDAEMMLAGPFVWAAVCQETQP